MRILHSITIKASSRKKLELLSAVPQATLTYFFSSPNSLHASITRYMLAKHEQILNFTIRLSVGQKTLQNTGKINKDPKQSEH